MICVTCKYAPMELFAGFGETVERLDPHPVSFSCADSCGHPNLCSYVKSILEEVYRRDIRQLVLTDCCDATRRLYDILKNSGRMEFLWFLPFPHKHGEAEVKLFEKQLRRLCEAYSSFCGREFDPAKAVSDYIERQNAFPERPKGQYIRLLGAHGGSLLYGELKDVFKGMDVVDDTCSSNRHLTQTAGEGDFFSWYASALLEQEMGCFRMWKNGGRNPEGLVEPAGTVFHTIKFCDYYGFEYMLEKEEYEGRVLKIETDTTPQSSGQLKTRLQAFREEIIPMGKEEKLMKTEGKIYAAGIDSGSASTDVVILDEHRRIIGKAIVPTGKAAAGGVRKAYEQALQDAGLSEEEITVCITTGYGRDTAGIEADSITEITCHAKGAHHLYPAARMVIDIGGQDSKVIRIDDKGRVLNFVMNDKCAAGTGRFLEMQARAMELSMEEMSSLGLEWTEDIHISSMCTVFAESEVVSLVAENKPAGDIIHGLNMAVAQKTAALASRLNTEGECIMTGGVALNEGVVKCLEEVLGRSVYVSEHSQICGALGAAIFALERIERS